jgi:hypothetical protein
MDSRKIMLVGLGQIGNIKLGRFVTAGTNAPTMEILVGCGIASLSQCGTG